MRFGKSTNDTQQRIFGCIRAEYFSILHVRCAPWIPQDSRESWSRILGSNFTEYFHFHAVCDILVFSSKYTFLHHYTFVFLSTEWTFLAGLSTARDIYFYLYVLFSFSDITEAKRRMRTYRYTWALSKLTHFVWKRMYGDALGSSVHAYTLCVSIKKCIDLKRCWKWIKTKTHAYRIRVSGRKRSKGTLDIKKMTEMFHGRVFFGLLIECNLYHNVQFHCVSNTLVWTGKVENTSKQ